MRTILNIKERPYGLLLLTAIALLLAFVFPPFVTIPFQDKTMFSLPLAVVVGVIIFLLISVWLLYILTRRFLYSMTITRIHVLITVSTAILMVIFIYIGINPSQFTIANHDLIGKAMQVLVVIFACGQFTYLANVLLGLFGRHKGI